MTKQTELHECAARLKLGVKAEFVPLSQSRNKAAKTPSLNWRVTLTRDGRDILTTDYGAGHGHCPAYKLRKIGEQDRYWRRSFDQVQRDAIAKECETGRLHVIDSRGDIIRKTVHILPDECDVIYSLVRDSDVLNYASFEEWAANFGYDADSRSSEKIYQACRAIALQLRNGLVEKAFFELQQACHNY